MPSSAVLKADAHEGQKGVNPCRKKRLARATKTQPTSANLAQPVPTYAGVLSMKFSFLGLPGLGQVGFGRA